MTIYFRPYSKEDSIGKKKENPTKEVKDKNPLASKPVAKKKAAPLKKTPVKKQSKDMVLLRKKINLSKGIVRVRDKNTCQGCGATEHDDIIDCSHTISEADCRGMGKVELMYEVDNIHCMCQHRCHKFWGAGNMGEIAKFKNYLPLMAYTKEHNPERYTKMVLRLKERI